MISNRSITPELGSRPQFWPNLAAWRALMVGGLGVFMVGEALAQSSKESRKQPTTVEQWNSEDARIAAERERQRQAVEHAFDDLEEARRLRTESERIRIEALEAERASARLNPAPTPTTVPDDPDRQKREAILETWRTIFRDTDAPPSQRDKKAFAALREQAYTYTPETAEERYLVGLHQWELAVELSLSLELSDYGGWGGSAMASSLATESADLLFYVAVTDGVYHAESALHKIDQWAPTQELGRATMLALSRLREYRDRYPWSVDSYRRFSGDIPHDFYDVRSRAERIAEPIRAKRAKELAAKEVVTRRLAEEAAELARTNKELAVAVAARMPSEELAKRGAAYLKGDGVTQDFVQARQWFQAAGYYLPESCLALGHLYAEGLGGPKDAERANMWFVCAASFGPASTWQIDLPAAERDFLRGLSNQDLATAFGHLGAAFAGGAAATLRERRNAYLCYVAAAQFVRDGRYDAACAEVATQLVDDAEGYTYSAFADLQSRWKINIIFDEKDGPTALNWLRVLAGLGDHQSQSRLGYQYENGLSGLAHDIVAAYAWYSIATYDEWDKPYVTKVGSESVSGLSGGGNLDADMGGTRRTFPLLTKAELAEAQFIAGEFFRTELRVTPAMMGRRLDPKAAAAKWYEVAAENGNPKAQYRLGAAYENGDGVARDQAAAKRWHDLSGLSTLD